MEIKEVKNYLPLLHSMHRCAGNCERSILLSHLDDGSFNFLCKWMGKAIQDPGLLQLAPARLRTLRKMLEHDKNRVKYLTKPGGSLTQKKKVVKQSGEGIGLILGVLAPVLINLVRGLLKKKKK